MPDQARAAPLDEQVMALLDKQAITEVIYRYSRGADRSDKELMLSAYWPDAVDEHGTFFSGTAAEFVNFAVGFLENMRTGHLVGNIFIELDSPARARAESYCWAWHQTVGPDGGAQDRIVACRYLDQFEKRGGEWRLIRRVVINDYVTSASVPPEALASAVVQGRRGTADPSYEVLGQRFGTLPPR